MSCNCNQQTNYNICNPSPCQEPQDCSCPTILKSDCVTYSGNDLECSGIVTGQTLTETIEQLEGTKVSLKTFPDGHMSSIENREELMVVLSTFFKKI